MDELLRLLCAEVLLLGVCWQQWGGWFGSGGHGSAARAGSSPVLVSAGTLGCWQSPWGIHGLVIAGAFCAFGAPVVVVCAGAASGTSARRAPGLALAPPGASAAGGCCLVMPAGTLAAGVLSCDTVWRSCGSGDSCWGGAGSRALPGTALWFVLCAGSGGRGGATFSVVMRGCDQG